jgi:hypothetical protein
MRVPEHVIQSWAYLKSRQVEYSKFIANSVPVRIFYYLLTEKCGDSTYEDFNSHWLFLLCWLYKQYWCYWCPET